MKNVLQRKHQRNKKKYFKSKHLEKRYVPPILLFYITILKYQFPNGMINKICNLSTFFFTNHFMNNFANSVINSAQSESSVEINEGIGLMMPLLK